MAEYLCEEDMNTGEYISRDVALRQLNATCLATDCDNYNGVRCRACAYADAMDFIDAIPAADVQPVKWISIKDKLPNEGERVLIYAPKTQSKYYVATFYTLRDEIKFAMNIYGMSYCWCVEDVTYWQPLPEPPKDGDTNG